VTSRFHYWRFRGRIETPTQIWRGARLHLTLISRMTIGSGFDTGKVRKYSAATHQPIELCHIRLSDIKMRLEKTCEYPNCEDNSTHRRDTRTARRGRCSQCNLLLYTTRLSYPRILERSLRASDCQRLPRTPPPWPRSTQPRSAPTPKAADTPSVESFRGPELKQQANVPAPPHVPARDLQPARLVHPRAVHFRKELPAQLNL
jgi:hypothetical protein